MNILDQILDAKKDEVSKLKKNYSLSSFRDMEFFEKKSLSFEERIRRNEKLSIIAEIKKASPSKGIIKEDFNHTKIAEIYFDEEVQAVSVLTDEIFFKGNIKFLNDIAKFKTSPLLRKDFIIDEYQVFEGKAYGADMILLICEALSKNQIKELTHATHELGMETLLELHSDSQLKKIDFELNNIIGINNRNLEDFSVNLETTKLLSNKISDEVIFVSESGISEEKDILLLKETKTNAVLVGEHLMKSKDIKAKLKELKKWCETSEVNSNVKS